MNESLILPPEDLSNEAVARRLVENAQQRLQAGSINKPNLVWLELNGCSGNIISLLNGTNPNFEYLINSMVNLIYSNSLMVAEGEVAMEKLMVVQEEEYILAVEGAVSLRDEGRYHVIGRWQGREITGLDAARILGEKAHHVIAVGACATHGGPSAAKPNLAHCVGLENVLQRKVIQLSSCPCHPDCFLGTLAHLLMDGEPALDERGRYLRDIIHGCEFLQNHIRHFYQYSPPISRNAHTMLAVLGGKAPHNHGIFVGGGTRPATVDKMIQMKSILAGIQAFIEEVMIPDAYTIAEYYDEYFTFGRGLGNFLCMGAFANDEELGTLYVDAGVYKNGEFAPFDPLGISESIAYSWYAGQEAYTPFETMPEPDRNQSAAYSWVKAPRYEGLPFEVGPLARLWLAGEYRHGISAMDRSIARVLEANKITEVLTILLEHLALDVTGQKVWKLPQHGEGAGLVETTRGSLGHWLKIEDQKLSFYQIITPSAWDFSTRTVENRGTAEQALIGTPIQDPDHTIELGRIIRSFDPCMSCATHVYQPNRPPLYQKVQGT